MDIPSDLLNTITTGDARELSKRIPDESVDMVFSDPVYWQIEDYEWLAETSARVLKPGGDVLVYSSQYHMDKAITAMTKHLIYRWVLIEKKISPGMLLWNYRLISHYIPLLWFTKGKPRFVNTRIDFMWAKNDGPSVNHEWGKGISRLTQWFDRYSLANDVVLDPFCGGGSIPSACKMLGRNYIAFEIDPATAEIARKRVESTQPPLFVVQHEQMDMPI